MDEMLTTLSLGILLLLILIVCYVIAFRRLCCPTESLLSQYELSFASRSRPVAQRLAKYDLDVDGETTDTAIE